MTKERITNRRGEVATIVLLSATRPLSRVIIYLFIYILIYFRVSLNDIVERSEAH